jgi:hypothetical protein
MTDDSTARDRRNRSLPLDQEQAVADLDQSIADREQALADIDQEAIEQQQADLGNERAVADPSDFASSVSFSHRQVELDHRQARGDARQDQIDQAQAGGDQRQDLLDEQQHALELPRPSEPSTAAEVQAETELRTAAVIERAENARRRAHQALRRAEAAEQRAKALSDSGAEDASAPGRLGAVEGGVRRPL